MLDPRAGRRWLWMLLLGIGPMFAPHPAQAANIRGKLLFLRCASCHDISGMPSQKIGPNLKGVVGRPSGSLPGYQYSAAMQKAHLVWDAATLAFAGLPSETDRQAVIAYLSNPGP